MEEEQDVENGEEVHELDENLLGDLGSASMELNETLLPDLDQNVILAEPDYNSMDNLTLLSSLNLHDSPKSNNEENLLSDLIN